MKKLLWCAIVATFLALTTPRGVVAEEPALARKTLGGLVESVEVIVDIYGIPHIYGEHEADAMFALGYMHAKDRLWQMDFNRRAAQGKLSEIMGPEALEHDVFVRTIGLNRLAREAVERAKEHPGLYGALTAYAWGINSYIAETMPDGLSPEFQKMGYTPDPWTPVDSLAIGKAMAWELCGSMDDLYLGTLVEKLGARTVDELFPVDRYREIPIIPSSFSSADLGAADSNGATAAAGGSSLTPGHKEGSMASAYLAAIEGASYRYRILGSDRLVGSNNWVIDGKKSATGKPILASDPHLGFSLPSVWYAAHVKARGIDVMGVTLPGAPSIVIGHGRHIAWGITNTQADVTDFFVERLSKDKTQYLHRGEWKPLDIISESIRVRSLEPREIRILKTVHGPILPAAGQNMSVQWAGAFAGDDALAYYLLNRAMDYDDFAAAMQAVGAPAQNFVYADSSGMIAMWVAGLFPVRKSGLGRVPVDGSSGDFDWDGFVPKIETPHKANPDQHYLASANQRPASERYGYYLGYEWDPGYRARRINQLLSSHNSITVEQMRAFQTDTYDTAAEAMLPRLVNACGGAFEEGKLYAHALEVLRNWDFHTTADSPAPTIWWRWLDRLRDSVWQDEWKAAGIDLMEDSWGHTGLNKWHPPLEALERIVVEDPTSKWFDDVATENRETLPDIAARSFRLALDELRGDFGGNISEWTWGVTNRLRIDHLTGDPMLGRGGHPLSGSDLTLSARGSGSDVTGGPSWRMVVDFSDLDVLSGVYPGGQSGDPKSLHYDDMIDVWVRDEYIDLPFHALPEQFPAERIEARLMLSPPLAHVDSTLP